MRTAEWIKFVAYRDFNEELSQADISIDIIRGVSELLSSKCTFE